MTNSNEADVRWRGITRPYSSTDVERVRGSLRIEHTLARRGAEKLWQLLQNEDYVAALGALTGNQAMQQGKAGLKAIYVSGWQVAADANLAGQMHPDQSLYPANSVPGSSNGSIKLCSPPIKSRISKAKTMSIGSCRSWPTPKPVL